ncbi:DUF4097 family beta strand repeat-containing protein [Bacillus massiliigorillae]|uniref:DUF4097 family beta strand repeat-containing protein n=1 Tax=Bacillus massiliigorillae TaxID=1243664 RepID=UPI0003A9A6C4|nr:DUF4097 family beta strand repeat-containing protein [Bacillus massiliigorillae]
MNEEKKRILNLVEAGKITATEALTLLEMLEKENQTKSDKETEMMNELSTVVVVNEEKEQQSTEKKVASAKDMILDFVDHLVTKVKDLDFDFSKSTDITHIFHLPDASAKDINIEVANGNVELIAWDQEGAQVECEAKVYRTENEADARKMLLEEVTFDVRDSKLYYMVGQKWMKVNSKVYLPKVQFEKMRMRLFNGGISAEALAVDKLKIKTANGKIILNDLTSADTEIDTVNGNIELTGMNITKLNCETINGAVKTKGAFQYAELETFNGGIFVEDFNNEAENLQVKSTSGSINVTVPSVVAVSGEVRANLGSLHVDVQGMKVLEEKKEVIQKVLKFENEQPVTMTLSADTKTGHISVKQEM